VHNTSGRQPNTVGIFSGLNLLAKPEDLPAGASPRTTNTEFSVGSVRTRSSLVNPFTFANSSAGPNPGGVAGNAPIAGGVAWSNFDNVLTPGTFATSTLSPLSIISIEVTAIKAGIRITSFLVVTFGINIPAFATGQTYTFSGVTGFTAINGMTLDILEPGFFPGLSANQAAFILATSEGTTNPPVPNRPNTADTGDAAVSGFNFTTFSDALTVKEFVFNVPETATPQGFIVNVETDAEQDYGLFVQMLKNGVPVGTPQGIIPALTTTTTVFGSINDLFGDSWTAADLNNPEFGVQITANAPLGSTTAFVGLVTIEVFFTPNAVNGNHVSTFQDDFGDIYNLALDAEGNLLLEDVINNPNVLTSLSTGIPANSFASMFTANSRRFMAISNLSNGTFQPQQYTGMAPGLQGGWIDRVSQVGPGVAPTFTPISTTSDQFAIATITQAAEVSHSGGAYFLQSSGPGSTAPGNVVTFYYADSTISSSDPGLVSAFNSGQPTFALVSFSGPTVPFPPTVVQITSVGEGQPPSQPRQFFFFTFVVQGAAVFTLDPGSGHPENTANYQLSLSTLTTSAPVPGLTIGQSIAITGSSLSGYDSTFTVTQTPNSGSFKITETVVSGAVATYSYNLINGSDPTAGQLVTVTGTNNGDGTLNGTFSIVSASGGNSGTFTVNVSIGDFAATTEEGQATTAGTIFCFDPGQALVGSTTSSPIIGSATGGQLIFQGLGQFVDPGTRQGTLFFITRNGYWSKPAPPVTFSASGNTITGIMCSNIEIGPEDVVARAIAFTEAGANGVPGSFFFTIPEPVQFIVDNVTFNTSSFFINDNTTTSVTLFFQDSVLLNATAIDIQGNNLFNLGELGNAAWGLLYAGRSVFGRVDNKIQNFLNLSMDGGFVQNVGGTLLPSGWSVNTATIVPGSSPMLIPSPIFGDSLLFQNNSSTVQPVFGMLFQSAFQDSLNVPILQNQVGYSVRVVCRTPASSTEGSLVLDLTNFDSQNGFGSTFGSFVLPLSEMTSTFAQFTGVILDTNTLTIPSQLQIRIWAKNIGPGANCVVDHVEVFPTADPVNLTGLSISYQDDWESFDQVSGGTDTAQINNQPANGGAVIRGQLIVLKESSMCSLQETPNAEPANWAPATEISNVAGASGINAYDTGEEWLVTGCQNGLFLWNGGQPVAIQLEVNDLWQSINWAAGQTLVIRNDGARRRILCAIPLPTPNPWCSVTTVNSAPTTPNMILMLDYSAIGDVSELMEAMAVGTTLQGKLATHDLKRKWSLWSIPTPYMNVCKRNSLFSEMLFCNGIGSSKIYQLSTGKPTGLDDSGPFASDYTTAGLPDQSDSGDNLAFGEGNKRYAYADLLVKGTGNANLTIYHNVLDDPDPFPLPGGLELSDPAPNDQEFPLNAFATRLFTEISLTGGAFEWSRLTYFLAKDRWSPIRGR
jgi:hypothetical protein